MTEFELERKQLAVMVKKVREQASLSQRGLSQITGISQSDISKIERGMANPSLNTISKIMTATRTRLNIDYVVESEEGPIFVESLGNVSNKIKELTIESAELIIKSMKDILESIILFGSCARGDNDEESDVDIAILSSCNRDDTDKYVDTLADVSTKMMTRYSEVVNFILIPTDEFSMKKSWYPFYKNIDKEGIVVYARR